jgi:hypothetical protein
VDRDRNRLAGAINRHGLLKEVMNPLLLRRGCLALLLILALSPAPAVEPAWQVRYAQLPDQTEEWTRLGRIPAWQVEIGDDGAVSLGGDQQGAFRGIVLLGRSWQVPAGRAALMRLEYQTYCVIGTPAMRRSGEVRLVAFTQAGWDALTGDPASAQKMQFVAGQGGLLWQQTVHPQGDDVTEWRQWEQEVNLGPLRALAGQTVILAVAWAAYHFDEEWAKFRHLEVRPVADRDPAKALFDALNLDLPALEPVREALQRKDLPAASAAFVTHMRTRTKPSLPSPQTEASAGVINRANETLDHTYRLASCPATKLDWPFLWNEDPHNYDQFAIALNRHMEWVALGQAYAATRDEKYAREFAAQVRSWVEAMPVYIGPHWIQGPFLEDGRAPLSLDAGIRMAQSWWQAYTTFKDSPSFDVAAQMLMFESMLDHVRYLLDERAYHPESNWGAMEANGLFHLAVMLPEFKEQPQWLQTAGERLVECLQKQIYPDGAQIELAPGYHGVTVANLVGSLELARHNGIALPDSFVAGLEQSYEYYVAIAGPDLRMPAVNDSGWGGVQGMLRQGLTLFPQHQDWLYLASNRQEGTPPQRTSWHLPYAGWSMMRTGWGPRDRYLFFETGPFGAAHQHEDQLSLILQVGAQRLLTEGGVYSYDQSDWRRYVLSSRAHNVIHVDGLEQNRRTRRETCVTEKPYESRWFTSDEFDFAQGTYDSGLGPKNDLQITHTRQVLFVKPDYWLVIDRLVPPDDKPHTYEALFHLDAAEAAVDEATRTVTVEAQGTGLRLIPLGAPLPNVQIIQGQKTPVVQGWLPTGRHNELKPIPTAIFRWQAAGPSVMVFALVPGEQGRWPVVSGTASGDTATLALAGGGTDRLVRTADELSLTRTDAAGKALRNFVLR